MVDFWTGRDGWSFMGCTVHYVYQKTLKHHTLFFREVNPSLNDFSSVDQLVESLEGWTANPLNHLLKTDSPWRWSQECEQSFVKVKKTLSSSEVLVHYNPDYPLMLAADASQYGVGAVT